MRKLQIRKNREGFTLAELLVTVAITVILASFGFVSVSGYQRRLKLTEMDNTAREIFIAAQNHLTSSEASGSWNSVYQTDAAESDFGVKVFASTLGISDSSDYYRAILSTRGKEPSDGDYATAWDEILPYGSITESVRTEGQYIVIYNASSASIYGVLYTDNSSNAFESVNSEFSFDLSKLSEYLELVQKTQNERVSYESGNGHVYIGWYGGALSKADNDNSSSADAPSLYFDNAEILKLNFNYSGSNYSYAVLKFTGNTSGAEVSVKVEKTGISPASDSDNSKIASRLNSSLSWKSVTGGISFSISLDDITRQGGNFGYIFDTDTSDNTAAVSSNGTASSAKFISGEDITVTAYAVRTDGTQSLTAAATANSLFEEVKGDSISISNGRHLQNLDASVSGILKSKLSSKSAKLTRNITWNTETAGFFRQVFALENSTSVPTGIYGRDGNPKASSSSFCSIYNDLLSEVDGNNHTLAYFSFAGNDKANNNAGLFAQNPNTGTAFSIHNLTISDSSSSSSSGNAGILMGQSTYGLTISDVHITATGNNSVTVSAPKGSAGGLIGYLASAASSTTTGSSNFTISDCYFVSSTTQNTDDSADQGGWVNGNTASGGFIGTVQETNEKITVTISDSYSNTYVSLRSDSTNGASAGGFIGAISTTDGSVMIQRSYAAGRTVSKVYPDKADGRGRYNVYSPADGTYAGGFIGSANGRLTINACFSAASVYSSGESSYSGGFIGAANGSSYMTIKGSYAAGKVFGTNHRGAFFGISSAGEMNASDCYALKGSRFNDSLSLISDNSAVSGIAFAESGAEGSPFAVDESSRKAATSNDAELGEFYPFMTTSQLSSAYLNDSSQSDNDKDNQYFGDWEDPGGTKILIVGVNGNKLTVHFAIPGGTTEFTIGVRGEDSGTVLYVPVYIGSDSSGNTKIYWENFLETKYGSDHDWNTIGVPASGAFSDNRSNDKSQYSQLYSESKEDFENAVTKSGGSVSADSGESLDYYAIDLDDLTVPTHKFSNMFANTGMKAGENISIAVETGWNKSFAINDTTGVTVNSLFDNGTDHSNGIALIANCRHLENLDYRVSGAEALQSVSYFAGFTAAEQVDNVHWSSDSNTKASSIRGTEAFVEELKNSEGTVSIYTAYSEQLSWDNSFFPIVNTNLITYRSRTTDQTDKYSLENITINLNSVASWCSGAAIFEQLGINNGHGITIQNLTLHNITSSSSRNESAGLVATAYGGSFSNISLDTISVVSSGTAAAGGLASNVTGGSFSNIDLNDISVTSNQPAAGGLAATVTGGVSLSNVTLTGSSSISCANQGSAGGLIGTASGSFTMRECAAYGNTGENASKISVSFKGWNHSGGGLIGKIEAGNNIVTIENSQAAVLVSSVQSDNGGNLGGGLIGSIANASSSSVISNSQSGGFTENGQYSEDDYNIELPSQQSVGGGLISRISDSNISISYCYSTSSVSASQTAGGFIGQVSNGNVAISNCYSTGLVGGKGIKEVFLGTATYNSVSGTQNYYLKGINGSLGQDYFGSLSVTAARKGDSGSPFNASENRNTRKYDVALPESYPFQEYCMIGSKLWHVGDWPESIIVNDGDVLSVEIHFDPEDSGWMFWWRDESLQVAIYGETSGARAILQFYMDKWGKVYSRVVSGNCSRYFSQNSISYDSSSNNVILVLDDITGTNGQARFAEQFPDFSPGENIDIIADYSSSRNFRNDFLTNEKYTRVTTNSIYADGSFTEGYEDTALIQSARHLENLSSDVSLYADATRKIVRPRYAKQVADIDVSGFLGTDKHVYFDNTVQDSRIATKWTEDGYLIGIINDDLVSYDGGGHTISNLKLGDTVSYYSSNYYGYSVNQSEPIAGLFAWLSENDSSEARDFTIENLTLQNPQINGKEYSGGLIGYVYAGNNLAINNIHITVASSSDIANISGTSSGGLVGVTEGSTVSITNSDVSGAYGSITGTSYSGGMIGYSEGSTLTVSNSSITGDSLSISSDGNAGGLLGSSENGSVSISDSHVAGSSLSISGETDAGGLIGSASGSSDTLTFTISNSSATAYVLQSADSVSGSAYYAGGLIGSLSWTGNVASITNTYAGGHTSEGNYLDTTDPSTAGRVNVYSANGTAGGLIGYQSGLLAIDKSFSAASVGSGASANGYSAGLIGYSTGLSSDAPVSISDSYSAGKVLKLSDQAISSEILNASASTGNWNQYLSFSHVRYLSSGSGFSSIIWNDSAASDAGSEIPSSIKVDELKALVSEENRNNAENSICYDPSFDGEGKPGSYPYPVYTTAAVTGSDRTVLNQRTYIGDWTETENASAKVNFVIEEAPEDESEFFSEGEASSSPEVSAGASAESTETPEASASAEAASSPSPSPSVTPEASPDASAEVTSTPSAVTENTDTQPSPSASAGGGNATPYLHAVKLSHPLLKKEGTEETGEPSETPADDEPSESSDSPQKIEGVETEEGDIVTEEDHAVTIERTVDVGKTISLSPIHPVEDGYTLIGWRLVDSESDEENTGSESLEVVDGSGNTGVVHYDYDPDAVVTVEGDMNLKAVFVRNDLLSFGNTWTSSVSAAFNPYPGNTNNCTWTAWQLVYETMGIRLPAWGDAGYWLIRAKAAGFTVSSEPAENSLVVFSNHVGFVTDVSEDGQMVFIREGNYSGMYHEGWWPAYGDRHGQKRYGYIWLSGSGTSDITEEELAEMEKEQAAREEAETEQKETEETIVISDGYYVGNNETALLQDLAEKGLSAGTRSEAYSNTAEAGTIIAHDSGTFAKGAAVNYTVSLGKEQVTEETAEPSLIPEASASASASSVPSASASASASAPAPSVSEMTETVVPSASASATAPSVSEITVTAAPAETSEPVNTPVPSVTEIEASPSAAASSAPAESAPVPSVKEIVPAASETPSASASGEE